MANKPPQSKKKANARRPRKTDQRSRPAGVEDASGAVAGFSLGFPVVAVGASAGGLEAFSELLTRLPSNPRLALIFITHLHPDYHSALAEILARETSMRVVEIEDRMPIQSDTVYVTRPGILVRIDGGLLHALSNTDHTDRKLPIDHTFRSLASDQTTHAIGIVLSGTASDGVLGLRAIKEKGGVAIAQAPSTAKYDGMPRNAIASGVVDLVLSPSDIATELVRISRHPFLKLPMHDPETEIGSDAEEYAKVFALLTQHKGNDFTYYKPSTIRRRIRRRMVVNKLEKMADYVAILKSSGQELEALFRDMLINVTEFFREPETFDALKKYAYPGMLDRPAGAPVRIWVPGCSTGEEAYSIAMSLIEYLADLAEGTPIQIFATDIDDIAIRDARAGIYSETAIQRISPERLRRFFYRVGNGYQICKPIRDLCVFAVQNITRDPPFSHLDLISCRNLLIYMGPVLQQRAIPMFHYALRPGGYLMLGSAESTGSFNDLFKPVDLRHRLYSKKASFSTLRLEFSTPASAFIQSARPPLSHPPASADDLRREVDRLIIGRYAPPSVLVDERFDILQFNGNTGPFMEPAPGTASLNLLRMVRQDLSMTLNTMLNEAVTNRTEVTRSGIKLRGESQILQLDVVPLQGLLRDQQVRLLVLFREQAVPQSPEKRSLNQSVEAKEVTVDSEKYRTLASELDATREHMRSLVEQQESSTEELRSANEEIQSSNEELQSINEELETAKEELQSTNEELATVNDELEARNSELAQVNDDLNNLISSVGIPIIIVGPDLRIRRFTPKVSELLNLIPTDVGRPISDIKSRIRMPEFENQLENVIDRLVSVEIEARDDDNRIYSVRMRPYRTLENRIEGAVVAFIDVTEFKQGVAWEAAGRTQLGAVVRTALAPQLLLDQNLRIVAASRGYLETFVAGDKSVLGAGLEDMGLGKNRELIESLADMIKGDTDSFEMNLDLDIPGLGSHPVRIRSDLLPNIGSKADAFVLLQFSVGLNEATTQ